MKKYQKVGMTLTVAGYLMMGVFWFGPSFLASYLENFNLFLQWLSLIVFLSGCFTLIVGSIKAWK